MIGEDRKTILELLGNSRRVLRAWTQSDLPSLASQCALLESSCSKVHELLDRLPAISETGLFASMQRLSAAMQEVDNVEDLHLLGEEFARVLSATKTLEVGREEANGGEG